MKDEGRSPWVYIGGGCAILVTMLLVVAATIIFVGFRSVRQLKAEMADPAAREAKALRLLGIDELPQGYYAGPSFSIPLLFDMAMLVDQPPDEDGGVSDSTERMFIYVKIIRGGRKWSDYTEGRADPMEMLDEQGFKLDSGAVIARDEMKIGEMKLYYVAQRGRLQTHDHHDLDGLATVMLLGCPGDKRLRVGIWTGPDREPELPVDEADFGGTPADPEAIRSFMSQFQVCGSSGG